MEKNEDGYAKWPVQNPQEFPIPTPPGYERLGVDLLLKSGTGEVYWFTPRKDENAEG